MMKPSLKASCFVLPLIATALGAAAEPAAAQSYPSDMIRIVVGGGRGHAARYHHPYCRQRAWTKRRLADRRGEQAGRDQHDCSRAKFSSSRRMDIRSSAIALPASAAPALLPNIGFRLDTDFAPVIKLMTSHHVLVVNPSVPAKSLAELVALLKSHPDKFTFSSGGFGTPAHLTGELFKLQTGVRAAHVPYRALPQAIGDLLNGTNHYQFITPLPVLDLIAAGKLRALAVTAPTRMPALKDVPTVVEEGFPELVIQEWVGFVVKSGTPDDIVARLNEAINKALAKPSVREALQKIAAEPAGGSPAEFGAHVKSQIAYWGKVVQGLRDQDPRMTVRRAISG